MPLDPTPDVADVLLECARALTHHVLVARGYFAPDGTFSSLYGARIRDVPARRRDEFDAYSGELFGSLRAVVRAGERRAIRLELSRDGVPLEAYEFALTAKSAPGGAAAAAAARRALGALATRFVLATEQERSSGVGAGNGGMSLRVRCEGPEGVVAPDGWGVDGEEEGSAFARGFERVALRGAATDAFEFDIAIETRAKGAVECGG